MTYKTVFIIPYRNREKELQKWLSIMIPILDNDENLKNNWYVLITHQGDTKLFNKGGLINSAFKLLQSPKIFPELQVEIDLNNITLILNDVDILPTRSGVFNYQTQKGIVKHPYGVKRPKLGGCLGGLVYINAIDYLKVGGMPNYWGWGGEDICLARRCIAQGLDIDESGFIERRTRPEDVLDPESHPTDKQKRFNMVTDKRNLRATFLENHLKPVNGLNECNFEILDIKPVKNWESRANIRIVDVKLNITAI